MARVSKRSFIFFRLSPVAGNKVKSFAIQQGGITGRIDVTFHQPWIRENLMRVESANFPTQSIRETLTEICYGTGTPPTFFPPSVDTVPFVRATDIKDGQIQLENLLHISSEQPPKMDKCLLNGGEVIVVRSGANTGDSAFVPFELAGSYAAYDLILKFKNTVDPKFIAYFLDTEIGRLQLNLVRGRSAQPHVNAEEVSDIRIVLPDDLHKQIEIVAAMDEARSQRKQKLAEADALLFSLDDYLLQTLGLEPPVKDERKVFAIQTSIISGRFDPHFHAPNFKKIYRLLSKTTTKALGEIVQFSKDSWNPKDEEKLTFRYIEISNVKPQTGEAIWTETLTKEAPSRARMLVHDDDIIVSLTRPHHASIAHLSEEFDGCIASTGFAVIRSVSKLVNREYLWCILRSQLSLQQMLQRASGGNYPAITRSELENIIIPIPEISIQEQIVAEIQRRRSESQRLRREVETGWQAAKQWFEDQLLGGS